MKRVALGPALAALALLAGAASAQAAGGGIVVHELGGSNARTAGAASFRSAKPMPLLSPANAPRAAEAHSRASSGSSGPGKPVYLPGRAPTGVVVAGAFSRAGATAAGFGKFDSAPVAHPTVYPNTTNGELIGKIPGVGTYSCSASVVHGQNRSTIFTAGHCAKEPGGSFATRIQFAPAYDRGSTPLGVWDAQAIAVRKAWANKGNNNYDYAAIVLGKSQGKGVEDVAGSKGFAYNVPVKKKRFSAVGYPFNLGHTKVMWECDSPFGGFDPGRPRLPGPTAFGIGCDMEEGASGGGWTIKGGYLASLSSFGYKQLPDHLYGPRFKKAADRLRRSAGRMKVR